MSETDATEPVAPGVPDPPAPDPAPVADAPVTTDGPWSRDLEATFADTATRAQVDAFLRGHIQPYVTTLEQTAKGAEAAQALITDLQNDPGSTYLALTQELFGPEAAKAAQEFLAQQLGEGQVDAPAAPEAPAAPAPTDAAPARDPEVDAWISKLQAQEDAQAYETEVNALAAQDPRLRSLPNGEAVFHGYVAATEGDLVKAYEGWKVWADAASGALPAPPAADAGAPPVVGSDAAGSTAPPVQPGKQTLDQALNDFFNEQRAAAPPPVGTV